jgi:predicted DNA-binding transcriptional regulator AlpA
MEMPNELWTIEEVTARWRLKPSWVYQHIRELPHIKLGNLVRFDPNELEQYLLKSKRGPSGNDDGNKTK